MSSWRRNLTLSLSLSLFVCVSLVLYVEFRVLMYFFGRQSKRIQKRNTKHFEDILKSLDNNIGSQQKDFKNILSEGQECVVLLPVVFNDKRSFHSSRQKRSNSSNAL